MNSCSSIARSVVASFADLVELKEARDSFIKAQNGCITRDVKRVVDRANSSIVDHGNRFIALARTSNVRLSNDDEGKRTFADVQEFAHEEIKHRRAERKRYAAAHKKSKADHDEEREDAEVDA